MLVNLDLNVYQFIKQLARDIREDVKSAYDEEDDLIFIKKEWANSALQTIDGRIRTFESFLDNLIQRNGEAHASNTNGTNRSPQENSCSEAANG